MEIVSEAHVLAEKSGLDAQLFESFLGKKFGDLMHSDSGRLTTGVYIPERGTNYFNFCLHFIRDARCLTYKSRAKSMVRPKSRNKRCPTRNRLCESSGHSPQSCRSGHGTLEEGERLLKCE